MQDQAIMDVAPETAEKIAMFIGETDELIQELRHERNFLRNKVGSYASGPEREVVETTVDHLVDAKFLKQADREQAVTAILDDPATALLSFCDKLAVRRCESEAAVMPKLGHAVDGILESDFAPSRESDKAFEHRFNALS